MDTRLTYPASLRLIRASRSDAPLCLEGLDRNPVWGEPPRRPDPLAAMLAHSGDRHAFGDDEPVAILYPDHASRSKGREVDPHVCEASLPRGSFARVYRRCFAPVLVESPELTVVRAAASLMRQVQSGEITKERALFREVDLIDELCGRYVRDPREPHTHDPIAYDVDPVTTTAEIGLYLDQMPKAHGLTLARTALRLAMDNLGSPLEALVATLLCAPPKRGGAGLPKPICNREMDLRGYEEVVSHWQIRPDLWWPELGLVIEVLGHVHDSREAVDEDARRVTDYQAMGLTVFVVRSKTVFDEQELTRLILNVAIAMGRTLGPRRVRTVRSILDRSEYRIARRVILRTI